MKRPQFLILSLFKKKHLRSPNQIKVHKWLKNEKGIKKERQKQIERLARSAFYANLFFVKLLLYLKIVN
jgi:hypothetical protein